MRKSSSGLGIGLALVSQLVSLHGGSIKAFSRGTGQGSTFTLRLPMADQAAQQSQTERSEPVSGGGRILIVDDSALARRSSRRVLEAAGYPVIEAEDGMSALEQYFVHKPSLVILDLVMKGMFGLDVLARLRTGTARPPQAGAGYREDRARGVSGRCRNHPW